MPKLTIITACSRPDNLETLAESILPGRDLFDITWRVVFDGMKVQPRPLPLGGAVATIAVCKQSVVGNYQKNEGLNSTKDGWVYFLDDDNIIHPDFFPAIRRAIEETDASAFVFGQAGGVSAETANPCPEHMHVDMIDLAQICLTRDLIGERRFQLNAYNADGLLYQQLYAAFPRDFVFINRPLCYYNHLGRV